jgi:hypothetical protein
MRTPSGNPWKFWGNVLFPEDKSNCWLWAKCKNQAGYGRVSVGNSTMKLAHRVAWEIINCRKIPDGIHVLHRCDNPPCVNPNHLFLGTQYDNMIDMRRKGRGTMGDTHPRSKLTREEGDKIRKLRADGACYESLCINFGISRVTLWRILEGVKFPSDSYKSQVQKYKSRKTL